MRREPIYAALLAQLQGLTQAPYSLNVPVISRGFVPWDQATEQPAIYLVPEEELSEYQRPNLFIKWTIRCQLWVYVQAGDEITLGVQQLTQVLDGIEAILMPSASNPQGPAPQGVNTLGGLVQQVAINGPTAISAGYLGNQTVARVPVEIITA